MDEADYWRDQAAKLREQAKATCDPTRPQGLLDRVAVAEEVGNNNDERAPSG